MLDLSVFWQRLQANPAKIGKYVCLPYPQHKFLSGEKYCIRFHEKQMKKFYLSEKPQHCFHRKTCFVCKISCGFNKKNLFGKLIQPENSNKFIYQQKNVGKLMDARFVAAFLIRDYNFLFSLNLSQLKALKLLEGCTGSASEDTGSI